MLVVIGVPGEGATRGKRSLVTRIGDLALETVHGRQLPIMKNIFRVSIAHNISWEGAMTYRVMHASNPTIPPDPTSFLFHLN